jgi:hypothetical protein
MSEGTLPAALPTELPAAPASQTTESADTMMNSASIESSSFVGQPGGPHPAFAESAANLTDMLRGLVIRWETLDFSISANCFDVDNRMQAWHDAQTPEMRAELLPGAYERQ